MVRSLADRTFQLSDERARRQLVPKARSKVLCETRLILERLVLELRRRLVNRAVELLLRLHHLLEEFSHVRNRVVQQPIPRIILPTNIPWLGLRNGRLAAKFALRTRASLRVSDGS